VERPSHKLARKIKLRSSRNSASPKAEIPYLPIEESGLPKEAANI
jgi:hypothetical protein